MEIEVPVIDADGHLFEEDAALAEYLPPPYRGRPRFKTYPFFPTLDGFPRGMAVAGKVPETPPSVWMEFLERNRIQKAVLYPTAGLAAGLILDRDWAVAVSRAYNDWLYDRYTRDHPQLLGVALLPVQDPEEAARELRRAKTELGFVAGLLPAVTALHRGYGASDFDPIYRAAEELDVGLAVHGAPSRGLGFDFLPTFIQVHTLEHPVALLIQLTSMLFEGVFDRFPKLRVAFLEAGSGWLPYFIDRTEEEFEKPYRFQAPKMRRSPREVLTSGQVWVTAEVEERLLPYTLQLCNQDAVMWPSDFPHERLPDAFSRDLPTLLGRQDLSEAQKRKILWDNPCRFYGIAPEGR